MKKPSPVPEAAGPGFSLVELLVALVIAGVLAGFGWPLADSYMTRARRSEGRAALLQAMQQQERMRTSTGSYAYFSAADPKGFRWYSGRTQAGSAYELRAIACEGEPAQFCILLEARPGTARVNASAADAQCGALRLDSLGIRSSDGELPQCWQ